MGRIQGDNWGNLGKKVHKGLPYPGKLRARLEVISVAYMLENGGEIYLVLAVKLVCHILTCSLSLYIKAIII